LPAGDSANMGAAPTVVAALMVSGSENVVRAPASRHACAARKAVKSAKEGLIRMRSRIIVYRCQL
jgi:hypothetical protein